MAVNYFGAVRMVLALLPHWRERRFGHVVNIVTWGVQIRNSEVGAATFAIESFILQLVCKNGMVVAKVLNARHIGKRLDDVL